MDTAVLTEIENLRRASLADLRAKFRELFQEPARSRHREHLFRRIAWRLQALAEGNLTERALGRAQQIARDADLRKVAPRDFLQVDGERVQTTPSGRDRRPSDRRLPLPGVVLSRKWKGRTILVEVLADGFRDQALALGWTMQSLYFSDGYEHRPFAARYGLVCYIGDACRIGTVVRQSIEIIGPPPLETRTRFYNPDVDQPWIKRMIPSLSKATNEHSAGVGLS